MGVLQTTVAELVKVKEHQRTKPTGSSYPAYSYGHSSSVLHYALCLVSRVW